MRGVGLIDEAGRMRLVGAGAAGAAFAVVLVMLVVSPWAGATTGVLVGVALPVGAVGAAIGVWLTLRSWRLGGGYERVVAVQRWVAEDEVPAGVPTSTWVPLVQAEADKQIAGWGKIVLAVSWGGITWSMRDQQPPVLTAILLALWTGLALWSAVWVIPRARAAQAMLRRGVATQD
ncbi:hypothetical protein [Curtobacterium sp. 9128]|uniref:hypothetical protein n=1 Tax=Curtobacterium sp. 9128 TaxID=1793722 RepID=UPI00119EB6CD|nr:hypothetical protein [Curtobacterium sp. 9128]